MNSLTMRRLKKYGIGVLKSVIMLNFNFGYCPICEHKTIFLKTGEWLRDRYICPFCLSIPRFRALFYVLKHYFPNYRQLNIHESSPSGPTFKKMKKECKHYTYSYYFPDIPLGQYNDGNRCENLEKLTFNNETFDVFITQDVLEHIIDPLNAFQEICRVLKPGGVHIFTVPYYKNNLTVTRVIRENGRIEYLKEKEYHSDPTDKNGCLVATNWGNDMIDYINRTCDMDTEIIKIVDKQKGIEGEFLEVFLSKKPAQLG